MNREKLAAILERHKEAIKIEYENLRKKKNKTIFEMAKLITLKEWVDFYKV